MKKMFLVRSMDFVALTSWLLCGHLSGAEPATPGQALSLNGSSGYISTANQFINPQTFSISVWFNSATTQGGRLLGFGDAQTGLSVNYDRHLYMDNNGHIFFGIYNGGYETISNKVACNDGNWHQAVGTLSSATGLSLYIDGVLATNHAAFNTAQVTTGWWKMGWDRMTGWPNAPTSPYFKGTIDEVQIWNLLLTATQIQANLHDFRAGTESGLVSYWHFDEGSGSTSADSTANDNTANLQGGVSWVPSTAPVGVPVVTTLAAGDFTVNGVTLSGTVLPNFQQTGAYFAYGLTSNYTATSAVIAVSAGNSLAADVSQNLGGLVEGTVYHFQLLATNSAGTNGGGDLTFTVPAIPPNVATLNAINITTNSALLTGCITDNDPPATDWFSYGTNAGYGSVSATGVADGALSFDGTGNDYVMVPKSSVPTEGGAYTIEAWIKAGGTNTTDEGIVGWGNWGNDYQVTSLRLDDHGIRNDWWGRDLSQSAAPTNLTGTWHHAAATYDGGDSIALFGRCPSGARPARDPLRAEHKPGNWFNCGN